MSAEPVVVREDELGWETWDGEARPGELAWKTLIGAPATPSDTLTLGVARVPPGAPLAEHRHAHAEVYLVLAGTGVVSVDGETRPVGPGTAVFIPGDARHGLRCTGDAELRFAYAFAADSFADVAYVFDGA
jgi:quercetin dioxygenase-like cupin family protein